MGGTRQGETNCTGCTCYDLYWVQQVGCVACVVVASGLSLGLVRVRVRVQTDSVQAWSVRVARLRIAGPVRPCLASLGIGLVLLMQDARGLGPSLVVTLGSCCEQSRPYAVLPS